MAQMILMYDKNSASNPHESYVPPSLTVNGLAGPTTTILDTNCESENTIDDFYKDGIRIKITYMLV